MSKFSKPLPSQEYLLECFSYDPDTGVLTWKVRPLHHFKNTHAMNIWNSRFSLTIAGYLMKDKYLQLVINYRKLYVHRVVWKLFHDIDVEHEIDHINLIKTDNRISNLRESTDSQNQHNKTLQKNNKTGFKGVSFNSRLKKFSAFISIDGKSKYLGSFLSAELAHEAYVEAGSRLRGKFFNSGL